MGHSTVIFRLRDASGNEYNHSFSIQNQRSDGQITEAELKQAYDQIASIKLPEGTTLVGDRFSLTEGSEESESWFQRHFGKSDSVQILTSGFARYFQPHSPQSAQITPVVTIPDVTVTGTVPASHEPPIYKLEDLPLADKKGQPIPTVRVEDLPLEPAPRPRKTSETPAEPIVLEEDPPNV